MRVLVISDYRGYHSTRPEANIFIALAKLGVKVFVMTYGEAECVSEFEAAGIEVESFHPQKKYDRKQVGKIRQYIIDKKIDVIHLFNNKAIINGIRAAIGLSVKVVLYRGYSGNIHWCDPLAYTKFLHPRVDRIMCNSVGVEECIQKQSLFHNYKTITINKGHDVQWYSGYHPHSIKQELGISESAFLLVNVANNRRMKGIPYLLNAIALLPKDANIHLLLIGKGMDCTENLQIIQKHNLTQKVYLLGFRKDVLNIVASTDVFVLPSVKGESITKSVIEAMSLEVAPLISDIAGNRELVQHNRSGLVFPSKNVNVLKDEILKLYSDRNLCTILGINAKKHVQNYLHTDQTAQKVKAMYEALLNTPVAEKERLIFRLPGRASGNEVAYS